MEGRTLFIAGLPEDVKEREIYLLFRQCSGYQGCRFAADTAGKPLCFATFLDHGSAVDGVWLSCLSPLPIPNKKSCIERFLTNSVELDRQCGV